jgi:hypothetical protein
MGSFLFLAVLVGGVLVVVGLVLALRSQGSERSTRDTAGVRFTGIGAIAYGALAAIGTLWSVIATLTATQVPVSLPVRTFWPEPNPGVSDIGGPTAEVVAGGFSVADVELTGLDLPARAFLAAGTIVEGAVFVLLAVVVAMLCRQLLRDAPFGGAVTTALTAAGVTLGIGGIVWQILNAIGRTLASDQALRIDSWASDAASSAGDAVEHGLPEPTYAVTIEFWPIFIALALLAVAAAFRMGERMQRDTSGLV